MPLSDLYLMNDEEITDIHKQMAKNFYNDDLYCMVFPDEKKRLENLTYFFKHYLHMIEPYSLFLADSKELHSVMVIFDSASEDAFAYVFRVLWMVIKMIPMMIRQRSWATIKQSIACWEMFTSRWVREFATKEYYHLDLLYTQEEYRKEGTAMKMIQSLHEEAVLRNHDISMETHHAENLSLYEKAGFALMSKITLPNNDITQYNLLLRIERG